MECFHLTLSQILSGISTPNDGLQGREFIINACYGAPDGKLFFGGLNGFNAFNPDEIEFNTIPPQVVFTDFWTQ